MTVLNYNTLIYFLFFNPSFVFGLSGFGVLFNHRFPRGCVDYKTFDYCPGQSTTLHHAQKKDYIWFKVIAKQKKRSSEFDEGFEVKNSNRHTIEAGNLHIKDLAPSDHAFYFYTRASTTFLECPDYEVNVYEVKPLINRIKAEEGGTVVLRFWSNIPIREFKPKASKIFKVKDKIMFDGNNGDEDNYALTSTIKSVNFRYRSDVTHNFKYAAHTYTNLTIRNIKRKQAGVWKTEWTTKGLCPRNFSLAVHVWFDPLPPTTTTTTTTTSTTSTTTTTTTTPTPPTTPKPKDPLESGSAKAIGALFMIAISCASVFVFWKFYLQKKLDEEDSKTTSGVPGGGQQGYQAQYGMNGGQPLGIQKQISIGGGQQGTQAQFAMNGGQPLGIQKQISIGGGQQGTQAQFAVNRGQPLGIQKQISVGGGQQGTQAQFAMNGGQPLGIQKQVSIGGGQQGTQAQFALNGGQSLGIQKQISIGGGQQGTQAQFAINRGQPLGIQKQISIGGGQQGTQAQFAMNGGQPLGIQKQISIGGGQQGTQAQFAMNGRQPLGIQKQISIGGGQQGTQAQYEMNRGQPLGIQNQMSTQGGWQQNGQEQYAMNGTHMADNQYQMQMQ